MVRLENILENPEKQKLFVSSGNEYLKKRVKLYLIVNLKIGPSGPKNRLNWGWPRNNSAAEKKCFMLR